MMKRWLLLLVVAALTGCAGPAWITTPPTDPAYRFQVGRSYAVTFSERLVHEPRAGAETRTIRTTLVTYTMTVEDTNALGEAYLVLAPIDSQVTLEAYGRPPVTHEGWIDRGRDPFDQSAGVNYLRQIGDSGLHLVVDATGTWRRTFRGGRPPVDFFARDDWPDPPAGMTVYPQPEARRMRPALFGTYMPVDWRRQATWTRPYNLTPHPPMTGVIPLDLNVQIVQREAAMLRLEGRGVAAGKPSPKSPYGFVQLGDVTLDLRFKDATYEARFDLDKGVPTYSRLELAWVTQRYADGLGEVISDDAQVLTFQIK